MVSPFAPRLAPGEAAFVEHAVTRGPGLQLSQGGGYCEACRRNRQRIRMPSHPIDALSLSPTPLSAPYSFLGSLLGSAFND